MAPAINNWLCSWTNHLLAVLYPPRCGSCRCFIAPGLKWCSDCWIELAQAMSRDHCLTCGQNLGPHQPINSKGRCPFCKKTHLPLAGVCRLGTYETALRRAVIHFKYHHDRNTGNLLADMLAESIRDQPWFSTIQCLCPVPLHWTRRLERGFNQSRLLADRLDWRINRPVIPLLKRIKLTARQVGLAAAGRLDNIKNAFTVAPRYPLTGARVLLVDDVMTTGSTLHEAARTLRRAGAAEIFAAVLAKAEQVTDPT